MGLWWSPGGELDREQSLDALQPCPKLCPSPHQDLQLFQEGGWDVIQAVAEFWCSRVEWSPVEQKYHLRGEGCRAG